MRLLDSPSTDPYFNIAAEEYLLKETDSDFAFIYANDPSIIIGKHQNAYAEINLPYIKEKQIPVVRRISGGGTVWHDPGNLNFSFILTGEEGRLVNFRQYAAPVLEYLQDLGVRAEFGSRNEILVDGKKISGNAEHVHRNRVLHHGTLLFSSDLQALGAALKVEKGKYRDKAVQSVRSSVANILDFLKPVTSMAAFRDGLALHLLEVFRGTEPYRLNEEDKARIWELVNLKYGTWEWNIAYSPRYSMKREFDWNGRQGVLSLDVEKGKIKMIQFTFDPELQEGFNRMAGILVGADHKPELIRSILSHSELASQGLIEHLIKVIF